MAKKKRSSRCARCSRREIDCICKHGSAFRSEHLLLVAVLLALVAGIVLIMLNDDAQTVSVIDGESSALAQPLMVARPWRNQPFMFQSPRDLYGARIVELIEQNDELVIRRDVLTLMRQRRVGYLIGIEPEKGGVVASVRLHKFLGGPELPTIKFQVSTLLGLSGIPPTADEALSHERSHLWELLFHQRPDEVYRLQGVETALRAYHLANSEMWAYLEHANSCTRKGRLAHHPIARAFQEGGPQAAAKVYLDNGVFHTPWMLCFEADVRQGVNDFLKQYPVWERTVVRSQAFSYLYYLSIPLTQRTPHRTLILTLLDRLALFKLFFATCHGNFKLD